VEPTGILAKFSWDFTSRSSRKTGIAGGLFASGNFAELVRTTRVRCATAFCKDAMQLQGLSSGWCSMQRPQNTERQTGRAASPLFPVDTRVRRVAGACVALLLFALVVGGPRWAQSSPTSELEFHSSNPSLNESFQWAKRQALYYLRSDGAIGPWYEAALPGRDAFCMRDVSHQAEGAAALGLFAANKNMIHRFADSVAASRNWAAFWEIDGRDGKPSTFDYVSDDDFWFNLPANFDVLDAAVRMWRWTGDNSYRDDSRFQTFFRKTLTDYIAQWQLGPDQLLTRPRIANQRQVQGKFADSRGIPSYVEDSKDFIFGTDLLAAEYRAIRSYQEIAVRPEDKALAFHLQKSADAIQNILETVAWDQEHGHFVGAIRKDLSGYGSGDTFALYFSAIKNPSHTRGALAHISDPAYWKQINTEEESYVPFVLFRYGKPEIAYQVLLDLADPKKPRREYPEVSYAVVAAIISSAMGIEPSRAGDNYDVQTLPHSLPKTDSVSVSSLRLRGRVLDIWHRGSGETRFRNREGTAIRWMAAFDGTADKLRVNGRLVRASHAMTRGGLAMSFVINTVEPGATAVVTTH